MPDNMTPEKKGVSIYAKVGAALGSAVLAGGIALGVTGANKEQPQPVNTETPSAAAASPTPKETTTVRPSETTKPTEAPKPTEALKVPCQILPIEYCSNGERVAWKVSGQNYTYIGFNFPAGAKVPVFAAVDGNLLLTKENAQPILGASAVVKTSTGENYAIRGNIDTSQFGNLTEVKVKAGEIIGYTQNTNAKSLGSYDLVFTISKAGSSGPVVEEDKLEILLPNAYKKPSVPFVSVIEPKLGTGTVYSDQK